MQKEQQPVMDKYGSEIGFGENPMIITKDKLKPIQNKIKAYFIELNSIQSIETKDNSTKDISLIKMFELNVQLIEQLIKVGGYLYVEVPNASGYVDHVFAPFQDFNTEHINHFYHPHLSNLLIQFGLTNKLIGEKVFDVSPGMSYPAIYSFWQKQESNSSELVIAQGKMLKQRILLYIESSKKIMTDIDLKLQSVLEDAADVIVWGTGQLAMKLLAETSLAKANIVAFVDGNPINQGSVISGITVLSPHQIQLREMRQPIIVTSILSQEAIYNAIQKMQLPNPVILLR
jgi:hypothetical protein